MAALKAIARGDGLRGPGISDAEPHKRDPRRWRRSSRFGPAHDGRRKNVPTIANSRDPNPLLTKEGILTAAKREPVAHTLAYGV